MIIDKLILTNEMPVEYNSFIGGEEKMKITKITSCIVMILSILVLAVLAALLVLIPYIANSPTLAVKYTAGSNAALRIYLYISDLAAIWFMFNVLRIMRSVSKETPFVLGNVFALKQMSAACLVAFTDFAVMIIAYGNYDRFGMIICTMILLFGTLCAYVLSRVFSEAVHYKAENDLTV